MTFPLGTQIAVENVNSAEANPSLARADIFALILAFNQLINSANAANGLVVTDGGNKINPARLPGNMSIAGNIQLTPGSGIVNVRNVLRLKQIFTDDLGIELGTESPTAGDLIYLLDGDAGKPCLGCFDGLAWRTVRLATAVGNVGSALAVSSAFFCDPD
jgi:hypothetical protein